MIVVNGHKLEVHTVETEDGYILQLFRIPLKQDEPLNNTQLKPKPACLVVHGLNCSGSAWFLDKPDKVLPCKLAAEGFDIWVASTRGTIFSRGHKTLNPNSKKYWDYNAHEMGLYDIPSIIDYILATTGNSSLYYIGHSLGCSLLFVTAIFRPEYNAKVKLMIALSPAVYLRHNTNKLFKASTVMGDFMGRFKWNYQKQIFDTSFAGYGKRLSPPFVNSEKLGVWLMMKIGNAVDIMGYEQEDKPRRAIISEHIATSTSVKNYCHIAQCLLSKQFQQYDYRRGNLKRYGQSTPPQYDLNQVTLPVVTFGAVDDKLIPVEDVLQASKELNNLVEHREINVENFTHGDFCFGKDADKIVYDQIIEILNKCVKLIL